MDQSHPTAPKMSEDISRVQRQSELAITGVLFDGRMTTRRLKDALDMVNGSECSLSEFTFNTTIHTDGLFLDEERVKFMTIGGMYCSPYALHSVSEKLREASLDVDTRHKTIMVSGEFIDRAPHIRVMAIFKFTRSDDAMRASVECYYLKFCMSEAVALCLGQLYLDAMNEGGQ